MLPHGLQPALSCVDIPSAEGTAALDLLSSQGHARHLVCCLGYLSRQLNRSADDGPPEHLMDGPLKFGIILEPLDERHDIFAELGWVPHVLDGKPVQRDESRATALLLGQELREPGGNLVVLYDDVEKRVTRNRLHRRVDVGLALEALHQTAVDALNLVLSDQSLDGIQTPRHLPRRRRLHHFVPLPQVLLLLGRLLLVLVLFPPEVLLLVL